MKIRDISWAIIFKHSARLILVDTWIDTFFVGLKRFNDKLKLESTNGIFYLFKKQKLQKDNCTGRIFSWSGQTSTRWKALNSSS